MRAFDIVLASLALRAAPAKQTKPQRRIAPAVDEPEAALLARVALAEERTAMVASLWPAPARQCVVSAHYALLEAPAAFGATWVARRR